MMQSYRLAVSSACLGPVLHGVASPGPRLLCRLLCSQRAGAVGDSRGTADAGRGGPVPRPRLARWSAPHPGKESQAT